MRYLLFSAALALLPGLALADSGVVTRTSLGCDYFLIRTKDGFVLAELSDGQSPDKGDRVSGTFTSSGYTTMRIGPGKDKSNIYVEDYALDRDEAIEKMTDMCR